MRRFAALYSALDATTKTNEKVAALVTYFRAAPPEDAAWAVYFLSGGRLKRLIGARKLAGWALEALELPEWLFNECYDAVGDIAETIALLLPEADHPIDLPLARWVEDRLLVLRAADEEAQRDAVMAAWRGLSGVERLVYNKLITGGFRVGVSALLIARALAQVSGIDREVIQHRLMGDWTPSAPAWRALIAPEDDAADASRPYPFFLAHAMDENADPTTALGDRAAWQAEWKWDGIRAQVIRRRGAVYIWSRGEDLITDRFPEIASAAAALPDGVVIDGEILPWRDGAVLPFAQLQRRIGRKQLGKKLLSDVPVILLAYDLLEIDGADCRTLPLDERRARLAALLSAIGSPAFVPSPIVDAESWATLRDQRADARRRGVEGLMLKRRGSAYGVGRVRGDWWKWKIEPLTIDAVLIYAQRGSGKRASLYTDYTFAVWDESRQLVPFAKAYSGLTDAEIREVDAFVRRSTREKFGPVRTVAPELVFELAFEGIQQSTRHKSGLAVRFPRILRWRRDKTPEDADTLASIRALVSPVLDGDDADVEDEPE